MIEKYSVSELVPHSGKMSLLTGITDYGDGWIQSQVIIGSSSMFADSEGVPAWVGLEYLAQTVAAYAGLLERKQGGSPKVGFLLGTRKYECSQPVFALGEVLDLKVELEFQGDNGLASYFCQLKGLGVEASAWVNVFQPEDTDAYIKGRHS